MSGREKASREASYAAGSRSMAADTGNISPFRRETPAREDVVDEEPMDSPVAILERVHEHESVGHGGGVDHRIHLCRGHPIVDLDQAVHQPGHVGWLGTHEVDTLAVGRDGLAHIALGVTVVGCGKARIDDAVLDFEQPSLRAEVVALGELQKRDEPFDAAGVRLGVLDREGCLGLFSVEVAECAPQQLRGVAPPRLPGNAP